MDKEQEDLFLVNPLVINFCSWTIIIVIYSLLMTSAFICVVLDPIV